MNEALNPLLSIFAEQLGWHGLVFHQFRLTPDICGSFPAGTIITTHFTTDEKFNLQINENPVAQKRTYQATIKAERYGLRPIPWQTFVVDDRQSAIAEALRLSDVLSRSILRNPHSRQQFIRLHPELLDYSVASRRKHYKLTGKR